MSTTLSSLAVLVSPPGSPTPQYPDPSPDSLPGPIIGDDRPRLPPRSGAPPGTDGVQSSPAFVTMPGFSAYSGVLRCHTLVSRKTNRVRGCRPTANGRGRLPEILDGLSVRGRMAHLGKNRCHTPSTPAGISGMRRSPAWSSGCAGWVMCTRSSPWRFAGRAEALLHRHGRLFHLGAGTRHLHVQGVLGLGVTPGSLRSEHP